MGAPPTSLRWMETPNPFVAHPVVVVWLVSLTPTSNVGAFTRQKTYAMAT